MEMILEDLWTWLDGKKTIIGAVLLVVGGAPHLASLIGAVPVDMLVYFGCALAGGGLAHKAQKGGAKAAK